MFNNDGTGIHWDCCGFMNTVTNTDNNCFAGMFEEDVEYITTATDIFPIFGCHWAGGSYRSFGLFYLSLYNDRSSDSFSYGFRACGYL